jgi:hypothetical protein
MKRISSHRLMKDNKEIVVQCGRTLYKLKAFAEITPTKKDMDLMFKKYHPMLLKEGE